VDLDVEMTRCVRCNDALVLAGRRRSVLCCFAWVMYVCKNHVFFLGFMYRTVVVHIVANFIYIFD
jgi:hypothetical protein